MESTEKGAVVCSGIFGGNRFGFVVLSHNSKGAWESNRGKRGLLYKYRDKHSELYVFRAGNYYIDLRFGQYRWFTIGLLKSSI